jgi:hypothetical protein
LSATTVTNVSLPLLKPHLVCRAQCLAHFFSGLAVQTSGNKQRNGKSGPSNRPVTRRAKLGGRLIYTTRFVRAQKTHVQATAFLASHPALRIVPLDQVAPHVAAHSLCKLNFSHRNVMSKAYGVGRGGST